MVVINNSSIKSCVILLVFTGVLFTSCTSNVPVSEPEVIPSIQLNINTNSYGYERTFPDSNPNSISHYHPNGYPNSVYIWTRRIPA